MSTTFTKPVLWKAITLKPWIRKVGANRYRVVPRTADHGKYELTVSWEGTQPNVESCIDYRTQEECLGFKYSGQCYHGGALLIKLVQERERDV